MTKTPRNPKVDAYIERASQWQPELKKLRTMLLGSGLTEELKWGKPCYTFEQGNVVILLPLKEHCALLFFKGALLKDPERILVKPGEHSQAGRQLRLTSLRQLREMEGSVKAYIEQAIAVESAGLKVAKSKSGPLKLPAELQERLDASAALKAAFAALTPGRQRSYVIHVSAAKQSATRATRAERCAPQILAGKGFNER